MPDLTLLTTPSRSSKKVMVSVVLTPALSLEEYASWHLEQALALLLLGVDHHLIGSSRSFLCYDVVFSHLQLYIFVLVLPFERMGHQNALLVVRCA